MEDLIRYITDLAELIDYIEESHADPEAFRFDGALDVLKRDLAQAQKLRKKSSVI